MATNTKVHDLLFTYIHSMKFGWYAYWSYHSNIQRGTVGDKLHYQEGNNPDHHGAKMTISMQKMMEAGRGRARGAR